MDKENEIYKSNDSNRKGMLYAVGIGPGGLADLTPRASEAISSADVIVGYGRYIELISELTKGKEIFETPMKGEVERCTRALELAATGLTVAVVSSGDAGIYGMAGLILELCDKEEFQGDKIKVEVIPGIPAFVSAASILGAPLMHDFASVSLSDLLTPWGTIKSRIECVARGDFVIALYNPRSRGRVTQLPEVIEIIRNIKSDSTPVGIVKNASRKDEVTRLVTLGDMPQLCETIDMLTVIIIGNNSSYITHAGALVTPRGYRGV